MNDAQLLRYSRHILLNEIGVEGQTRLLASHVLIVGAGGLGCPAALYMASSGVGRITIVDHDRVEVGNLQRQIAHRLADVGAFKAVSIAQSIQEMNPDVSAVAITQQACATLLDALVPQADLVLDCTDNFSTRQAINHAAVKHKKPLVSGAALGFDGQVSVFDPRNTLSPCYACLFPPATPPEETNCATMGVFAPLVGIVGSLQAAEGLKILSHVGQSLAGRLLVLHATNMGFQEIQVRRQPDCTVCG